MSLKLKKYRVIKDEKTYWQNDLDKTLETHYYPQWKFVFSWRWHYFKSYPHKNNLRFHTFVDAQRFIQDELEIGKIDHNVSVVREF